MKSNSLFFLLAAAVCLAAGCASPSEYAEERHQRLLKIYPLQSTTRSDVAKKWTPTKPEFSHERPSAGWPALAEAYIGRRAAAVEKQTNGNVTRVERYLGADGFFSLCRCWFYYDANERLVDVEWQYVSD